MIVRQAQGLGSASTNDMPSRRARVARAANDASAPQLSRYSFEPLESRVLLAASFTVADELLQSSRSEVDALLDAAAGRKTFADTQPTTKAAPAPTKATTTSVGAIPGMTTVGKATTISNNVITNRDDVQPPSDFRYILRPGTGFNGATPQPPAVGNPSAPGYDAKAIARWDVVPYQTFDGMFNVGVVAFHMNGIDRVEFSVNGGTWTAVRRMTQNPQTSVKEYTATLRASDFHDGQIEVRAVAYPTVGEPRVLDSLLLNTNANHTLSSIIRWVSPTGSDATGDGSEAKPYATIMKAARAIQDASNVGTADGATIYLTAGDHVYGMYSPNLLTTTECRWLTIAAAPGLSRDSVRLVGGGTSDGVRTKLVKLHGLTVTTSLRSNGPLVDEVWIDSCDLIGSGRTVSTMWTSGWTSVYATSSSVSNSRDAINGVLNRNLTISNIGSDAFQNVGLVVNAVVQDIDKSGTDFHPDVAQYYTNDLSHPIENRIVYGLTATTNIGAQGLFAGSHIPLKDIAFVDCTIDNSNAFGIYYVFQFGGAVDHMYISNSHFSGPLGAKWRVDLGFSAHNIVVQGTYFERGPGEITGVTYR